MTDKTREAFEAHIAEMIVSQAGLDIALERDEAGDYETSWVQSGWKFWQGATLKANQWRPIADAPRDGTPVLLWADGVVLSRWYVHYMNGKPDKRRPAAWEQPDMHGGFGGCQGALNPTHFKPLPLPPTGSINT